MVTAQVNRGLLDPDPGATPDPSHEEPARPPPEPRSDRQRKYRVDPRPPERGDGAGADEAGDGESPVRELVRERGTEGPPPAGRGGEEPGSGCVRAEPDERQQHHRRRDGMLDADD